MQIVWFKHDLRLRDHEPLFTATKNGISILLYIIEPELWRQPDLSFRHYDYLVRSLGALDDELKKKGHKLLIKVGDAVKILEDLCRKHNVKRIYSYKETWNSWTRKRDIRVKDWVNNSGLKWIEFQHNGVVRNLSNRNGWSNLWYSEMRKPIALIPATFDTIRVKSQEIPSPHSLGLNHDGINEFQKAGSFEANQLLESFMSHRGRFYTSEMSSPLTATSACSRLSPHFSFGSFSIRQVFQKIDNRNKSLSYLSDKDRRGWTKSFRSFQSRLRWHCHFIQKLEDEHSIEFESLHPDLVGLREDSLNLEFLERWKLGLTGYPMIDACMRSLVQTGWINFRMRAMLVSFASYHLWLHWRPISIYLANLFLDYEPGIHYSQVQMQSGTTGINAIRIYNPIKQSIEHDPEGVFIRRWVPELRDMKKEEIHEPWNTPNKMNGYPIPVVDEKSARKNAASKIFLIRKKTGFYENSKKIFDKHGSRKKLLKRPKKNKASFISSQKQFSFEN